MDFEDIIPFLIVIFYLLSSVLSKIGQRKTSPSGQQAAGEKKEGLDLLKDLLTGRTTVEKILEKQAKQQRPEAVAKKQRPLPQKRVVAGRVSEQKRDQVPVPPVAGTPATKGEELIEFRLDQGRLKRGRLRRAVVWSELLGKPLALRDEQ